MCSPAAAMMGVSAGQGLLSIMGQQSNQKMQIAYQEREAEARNDQITQNRTMATSAYVLQVEGENQQKAQQQEVNSNNAQDLHIQEMKAAGSAKAAAADAGVGGASLTRMLGDFNAQEGMMLDRIDVNQQFQDQASQYRVASYGQEYTNRLTQVKPYMPSAVPGIDYLSPILGIGKSGLTAFNTSGGTDPKTGTSGTSITSGIFSGGYGSEQSGARVDVTADAPYSGFGAAK